MSAREFRHRLGRRAERAGIDLSPALAIKLEQYYTLLAKWNRKINLTSFALPPEGQDEAVDRLFIEPLVAARHVPARFERVLDVGSGGGSPAIPLQLALPRLVVRMVERKTRKAVFLREAVRALGLTSASVEATRIEELLARPELHEGVDLITVRAVRIEPRLLTSLQAFLRRHGQVFLFRGPSGGDVGESQTPTLSWMATFPLVDASRSRLVVLEKNMIGRP